MVHLCRHVHTRSPPHNYCRPNIIKFVFFVIIFIKSTFNDLAYQMPPSCIQSFHIFAQPKIKIIWLPTNQRTQTNFHLLQSFVDPYLYLSPHHLSIIFLICSMLGFCTKVKCKCFATSWIAQLHHKFCLGVQLWEIIYVPSIKSSISTLQ